MSNNGNNSNHASNLGWASIDSIAIGSPFIGIDYGYPVTVIVSKQQKVKIGNEEGYECDKCKDFYPMAELNQPDGSDACTNFTCYGCRKGLKTIFIGESK